MADNSPGLIIELHFQRAVAGFTDARGRLQESTDP
jgi:hypothetical protein